LVSQKPICSEENKKKLAIELLAIGWSAAQNLSFSFAHLNKFDYCN
jgi:hypothetical protein